MSFCLFFSEVDLHPAPKHVKQKRLTLGFGNENVAEYIGASSCLERVLSAGAGQVVSLSQDDPSASGFAAAGWEHGGTMPTKRRIMFRTPVFHEGL